MSTNRDILADDDGDMTMTAGRFVWASDADAIAQSLSMRLQFFLEEWFADETAGLPLFQKILVKNPNLAEVREAYRTEILGTTGVNNLIDFESALDSSTREFAVTASVDTDFGELTVSATVSF